MKLIMAMAHETVNTDSLSDQEALRAENTRLKKIANALMDRAERQINTQDSGFNLFQTMIVLEDRIRNRTAELEAALRENEKITRALRISEEKYRTLITQSLVGIGIYESGKIVFANSKLAEIYGYSIDELLLCNPTDLIDKNDLAIFTVSISKTLSGEENEGSSVYCGITKDKRKIFVEILSKRLLNSERESILFTCMDITQRVADENEIQSLNLKLRDMSIRDSLTGLFNRRYLDEMLAREIALAKRNNSPLSLIMGDMDHFKLINDTYGHPFGDQALKMFSQLIINNSRASDISCRYGGEEFLLICPNMTGEKALERAEQLRIAFSENKFNFGGEAVNVSASFGVSTYPQHGKESYQLIMSADKALLQAKEAGRNQVIMASG